MFRLRGSTSNSRRLSPFALAAIALLSALPTVTLAIDIGAFRFYNGAEFPGAKGDLQVTPPRQGDSILALAFDFSLGGNYVSADVAPTAPVVASHARFEVNAPLLVKINARVIDETGQILQFVIDRSTLPIDTMGWSIADLAIASSTMHWGGANDGLLHGRVKKLSLLVDKSLAGNIAGTAYFRRIELLAQAPSPVSADSSSNSIEAASFNFYNGVEFPGATGNLQIVAPSNSESHQTLAYDFTGGGKYVSADLTLSTPADASYVRVGLKASTQTAIGLRVIDETGQILQFAIDRSSLSSDSLGWSTATIPVGNSPYHWGGVNDGTLHGRIRSASLVLNKPSSGNLTGVAYFKRIEFLDHAPSASYPVLVPTSIPIQSVTFYGGTEYPGAAGNVQITDLPNGDVSQALTYDFSGGGRYVAATTTLQAPAAGNRLRFLAKIPPGIRVNLRFTDQTGQIFQIPAVKSLATLADPSWVQFAVTLNPSTTYWSGANDGVIHFPIKNVSFVIENTSSSADVADGVTAVSPRGTAYFKQLILDNQPDQLDLAPNSVATPGLRRTNTDPMQTMGVVIHNNDDRAFTIAQAMGFKHVRFDMNWMAVEKVPGVYDFSLYDTRINALRAHRLAPQAILDYNHSSYAANYQTSVTETSNLLAFGRFARQAALRYYRQGVAFELWNEPSRLRGWTVDSFATFVRETASQIRSTDPSSQIISGGLAYIDFPYIDAMAKNAALANVTGVGVHPYSQNLVERQGDLTVAATALLSATGVAAPLWTTEVGASSVWYDKTNGANPAAQHRQAIIVSRQILTSWATNVPSHTVYQLRDEVATYNPVDQEHNFGLLTQTYAEKPAKKAVDLLFATATNRRYQGLLTGVPTTVQAMKFAASGYETVYVVWANTPKDNAVVSIVNQCDPTLDFAGKKTSAPTSCAVDVIGNPIACTRTSNARALCPVSESAGPIFVRMKAN